MNAPVYGCLARQLCADRLTEKAAHRGLRKGPGGPDFDIMITAGPLRVEIVDPQVVFQANTQFASVTTTGLVTYGVAQVPGGDTIVRAGDKPITVVPSNTALSPQVVPPMFEVTVNDTTISEPQLANLIFRDNFD